MSECWCFPQTDKAFYPKEISSKQYRSMVPKVHVLAQLMNKGQEQRNPFYLFLGCQAHALELAEDWRKRTGKDHLEDSASMRQGPGLAQRDPCSEQRCASHPENLDVDSVFTPWNLLTLLPYQYPLAVYPAQSKQLPLFTLSTKWRRKAYLAQHPALSKCSRSIFSLPSWIQEKRKHSWSLGRPKWPKETTRGFCLC